MRWASKGPGPALALGPEQAGERQRDDEQLLHVRLSDASTPSTLALLSVAISTIGRR